MCAFCSYASAYAMDVIAYTTYGIELDTQSDPDNMFVTKSKKALDITLRSPKLILICQLTFYFR